MPDQNDFKNTPVHYVKVLDIIFIIMLKSTFNTFSQCFIDINSLLTTLNATLNHFVKCSLVNTYSKTLIVC